MAYRIAVNFALALPLTKYIDHISQLAEPSGRLNVTQWQNYDKHFRSHAASKLQRFENSVYVKRKQLDQIFFRVDVFR